MCLERLAPGGVLPIGGAAGAQEVFVLEGEALLFEDDASSVELHTWSWLRRPQESAARIGSVRGSLFWTQRGDLPLGHGD